MAIATINRFISLFDQAFGALQCQVSLADAERLAVVVHHSMDSKKRAYHTAGHVFEMCEGMKPRQVLAALFHDVVYYQLDSGFPAPVTALLQDVVLTFEGKLVLRDFDPQDRALALCAAIFEFAPGQVLPLYDGMNEFLSAVVAARLLQPYLSVLDLMAVLACIEATIPFRAPDAQGSSATDNLAQRVQQQYLQWVDAGDLMAARTFADQAVADAACLANRDVSGFAKTDPGLFLSSTWLLIDESNAPLASPGIYSLQEYRIALMRMDTFLATLNPEFIFQHHNAIPPLDEVNALCVTARGNIAFACDFLDAKITSVAIIEALALCTGADCPVSMFLGDIRSAYGRPDRVEDFLPQAPLDKVVNETLLHVLEKGRTLASNNDLTASPLTAFIYRYMGHEGTQQALALARDMFDGVLAPKAFLQRLNRDMVCAILRACANIALSRRDALLALEQSL